jgi:hypothetical protein
VTLPGARRSRNRQVLVMVYPFQGHQRVLGGLRGRRLFRPPRRKRPAGREFRWAETGGVKSGGSGPSGPHLKGLAMSDKSPRQSMTKKSGKSLKEKHAAKHPKAAYAFSTEALCNVKKR